MIPSYKKICIKMYPAEKKRGFQMFYCFSVQVIMTSRKNILPVSARTRRLVELALTHAVRDASDSELDSNDSYVDGDIVDLADFEDFRQPFEPNDDDLLLEEYPEVSPFATNLNSPCPFDDETDDENEDDVPSRRQNNLRRRTAQIISDSEDAEVGDLQHLIQIQ